MLKPIPSESPYYNSSSEYCCGFQKVLMLKLRNSKLYLNVEAKIISMKDNSILM